MRGSRKIAAAARALITMAGIAILSGCANMYVDGTTKEVSASTFKKPEAAHPVQVLFEFQTKGVANATATGFLKTRVIDQVKESGLFSDVSENPAAGGAMLSITLNNVPVTDDAFSKGFLTGLTFGLAGSQVSDGYVCTARYLDGNNGQAIVKKARHAIHTTIGAAATPQNATKAANADEAVFTMTRQVVSNVLNDLSLDSSFK